LAKNDRIFGLKRIQKRRDGSSDAENSIQYFGLVEGWDLGVEKSKAIVLIFGK